MKHVRLVTGLLSQEWAIETERALALLEIVMGEAGELEAVEKQRSRRMDGTEEARQRNGVGIVSVRGPITRYADSWAAMCGATSVETLARDFNAVLSDPNVTSILLNIDSPGGEVNGIAELAQMVFDARARKPIVAYVGGMGASAAYWIASAADEIVAGETALLGSIGVVAAVPNPDAKSARDLEFVSSRAPHKRPNPNTEAGRAHIQARIDSLEDIFVSTIARNRDVTADDVVERFGQGGVLIGAQAVEAGLADRLGSFEGILVELAMGKRKPKHKMAAHAAEMEDVDMPTMAELKKRVLAAFAGDDEATITQEQQPQADAETQKQRAEAREQLASARQLQFKAEATEFVAAQVKGNRVLPAETDKLTAQLTQAASDDAALPLAGGQTRVQTIKAVIEARPAHKLTEELVVDDKHKVLRADANGDGGEMTDKRKTELLNMTPMGQTALKAVK